MSETPTGTDRVELTDARCGYTVTDVDGNEEPCDLPAMGHRWYQDVGEHEDMLDVACDYHRNEGGRLIASLRAELAAANARCAELEHLEHERKGFAESWAKQVAKAEALQATLDRVTAVINTPDGKREWHNQGRSGECDVVDVSRVRAALTPEGKS